MYIMLCARQKGMYPMELKLTQLFVPGRKAGLITMVKALMIEKPN